MSTIPSHQPGAPTDRDTYFFDLHGCIIVRGALSSAEVAACNRVLDDYRDVGIGEWRGWVHGQRYSEKDGLNLQQVYEAGEPFERLLDHPSWYEKARWFVGGENTFDYNAGPMYVDEAFATFRGPGESIPMHSGGSDVGQRCRFSVMNRKFYCGQVNVLMALTDIGPGDGATMVVPGSHKANFNHHELSTRHWNASPSMDGVEGAIEVHLRAGDALMFVDAIMHGSAARLNAGDRRTVVYRYGPSYGNSRHGYRASPELVARLPQARRQLVQPQVPLAPPVAVMA